MEETMNKDHLKQRLLKHLEKRGINPSEDRNDLPVGLVRDEIVPLRGSVHISSGNIALRKDVERLFKKVKFV